MRLGRKAAWARADAELFLKADRSRQINRARGTISSASLHHPDYYKKRKEERQLLTLSFADARQ